MLAIDGRQLVPYCIGMILRIAIALALPVQLSLAQNATAVRTHTGVIEGAVTDSALRPIAAADVSILFTRVHVTADAQGRFAITHLPAGHYVLAIRRLGFHPTTASIALSEGDTLRPALILKPAIAKLEPVNVTATTGSTRLREFDARRALGFGEFWTADQIDSRHAVSTVDILRESLRLRVVPSGPTEVAMSRRQWTPCPMQVYVDGVVAPLDLEQLPAPAEILGIEVYGGPSEEPLWLPRGSSAASLSCGALLVWTKDGSER
jgi:carboxypeptidase family protein